MPAITDEEMLDALREAGNGERRVEISAAGTYLIANGRSYEIDLRQADVLFSTMFGHSPA